MTKEIRVWLDKEIGLYTVGCADGTIYECLSKAEVVEVVKEVIGSAD